MPQTDDAIEPFDLYIWHTTVEGVKTNFEGQTWIKLAGIQDGFWVTAPVKLRPGDRVKLSFHKDVEDAQP